jgi:hypothetical protein
MEDEGGVEEDSGKQVGGTEVRHFRDCWEFSTVVSCSFEMEGRVPTEPFGLI